MMCWLFYRWVLHGTNGKPGPYITVSSIQDLCGVISVKVWTAVDSVTITWSNTTMLGSNNASF